MTSAVPRSRVPPPRSRVQPLSLAPAAVTCDQPVGEARERDRDRDEEDRRHEIRREVERGSDVDLGLVERLERAEEADERRVLLQADEIVQERRDYAPDCLGEDHLTEGLPPGEPQ